MPVEMIKPDWQVPVNVKALTTLRSGGVSVAPYDSFNLADHVGDNPDHVRENRKRLMELAGLPADPVWLQQVHGIRVTDAAAYKVGDKADGSFTSKAGVVCAVLTADCLPVFLSDQAGEQVAVLHAGWRGLANGVIEQGVAAMHSPASSLLVWLGSAIGAQAFAVGDEVRQVFIENDKTAEAAFRPLGPGKWLADIYQLARLRLQALGVQAISGGDYCTYTDDSRFYSFRRRPMCGRMASLIWLDEK
ncbi:MAG: purine nucleoside phosphorylase YfiH [Gammaproteobacteria bacterium]|nr:MAG: purine nucleoside phosphorylase YfiH [Gammaproteobacteria bacterium]